MVLQLMGSDQIVLKKGEEPVIFLLVPRPPPFPVPIPNSQNRFVNVMVSGLENGYVLGRDADVDVGGRCPTFLDKFKEQPLWFYMNMILRCLLGCTRTYSA